MLRTLKIENIAVIENAQIEFNNGLNVLTGETGAGKSIVVDAINAILGERTSKELVRHGADFAFVSAFFEDISSVAQEKLLEYSIDCEEDNSLLLTRRISATGKSSCKINGNPATVSMLKEIGGLLVNIHGQHDSQALLNPDVHFEFIDMISNDKSYLENYKDSFKQFISIRRKLKALTADEDTKDRQIELLEYQIKELEDADIKIGEREELLERKKVIENAESIMTLLSGVSSAISGDEESNGAETLILSAKNDMEEYSKYSENIKNIYSKLIEVAESLEDIKDLTETEIDSLDFDKDELEKIEERLDVLYRLSLKYGETEEEMLKYLESAKEKYNAIKHSDEELERLNALYDSNFAKTVDLATELSNYRKKVAKDFEEKVKGELLFLDMPKIQFVVDFEKANLSSTGFDKIEFMISANPGEPLKSMSKIASGGELSRIMLAIKNIIAHNDTVGTLIFDEIDTGVSGRASRKIGLKLKSVSKETQVITVTHSAQIASVADEHFLIEKDFNDDKTYTKVTPLNFEERKYELARIMGGLQITDNLLQSAEEMLLESNG